MTTDIHERPTGGAAAGLGARLPALMVAALLLHSAPSHAYLDPGTGSIILQGLLAGIAVALGVARAYWQRIKAFFARADSEIAERNDATSPTEESKAKSPQ